LAPITNIFEIIAFIASIYFFLKKGNKLVRYFMVFLFITVCVETVAWVWSRPEYRNTESKFLMYNVFFVFEFVCYAVVFYHHFNKLIFRRIAGFFILGIILFGLVNMFFLQGLDKTINNYTLLLGSFFVVLFCCFYFYESIQPEHIDDQLSKQPMFWISSGLLIFYLGSVIITALFDYLRSNALQDQGKRTFIIINHFLNVILYSSFCIAFYLCPDRKKTSSLPSS
jgi:ABC-type multidrug transport system fused ATPase/permease subunit